MNYRHITLNIEGNKVQNDEPQKVYDNIVGRKQMKYVPLVPLFKCDEFHKQELFFR